MPLHRASSVAFRPLPIPPPPPPPPRTSLAHPLQPAAPPPPPAAAERDELAVAMDESLREEEARKRQQKPLHEREDGEILRVRCWGRGAAGAACWSGVPVGLAARLRRCHSLWRRPLKTLCCPPLPLLQQQDFADSAVLAALLARAPASNLLAPPLRRPLLDYLQLEKR